ncbi:glutathione S-transferase T3-like [Hordeum vulgare]|nr:glutathione S-transferase T3-like [Hordeum vulgare]
MLRMDDSDEDARNECKPEGNKKDKLRKKMEVEASSIREKMEHMMKSRKALTMKTLETKLLINEKKKEVKLAQVEARREEAKRKADLEERMIEVKEAKAWRELMMEEKEHMMMSKKDMDKDQLMWWKEYKEDIAERKRTFRGSYSTLRVDSLNYPLFGDVSVVVRKNQHHFLLLGVPTQKILELILSGQYPPRGVRRRQEKFLLGQTCSASCRRGSGQLASERGEAAWAPQKIRPLRTQTKAAWAQEIRPRQTQARQDAAGEPHPTCRRQEGGRGHRGRRRQIRQRLRSQQPAGAQIP